MKPRQLLLLAIPLVAALAFLICRGSLNGPESTTPPPLAPSSGPAAAGARDPSTLGAREVAEDSAGEARTAADTAALSPPGDAAGSAEPVVWSGRVIDPAGNPLREARVKLIKDQNVHRTPGVIWNRAGAEAVVESACDAKGRFRLEERGDPGPLQIVAYQTGFQVYHGAAKERELGDLVLEPGMVLGGFVLSSSGVPVAGARVRRLAENRGPSPFFFDFGRWMNEEDKLQPGEVLTDEDGRFEFPHEAPGAYRLEARHRQHPTAEIEGQGREGEVLEEHIVLPRAASVSGSVAGVPAETDAKLRVLARRVRSAEERDEDQGDGARFFPGGGNLNADRSARIADGGSFLVEGLLAGETYELWACQEKDSAWNLETCSARLSAPAGSVGVELRFQLGCQLHFQVVDASTSEPLEDLVVQHNWRDGDFGFFGNGARQTTERYEGGRVVLDQLRPPTQSSALQLVVRSPGHRKYEQEVVVPDEGSLDLGQIRLAASAQMAFTVRDAAGQPVEGARVALRNSSGNSWGGRADWGDAGSARVVSVDGAVAGDAAANAGVVQAALNPALATGVTDEAGRCVLDLPDATEADLRITAPDFARYEENGIALPLVGVREKTVTLSRGGGVRLLVVESTGEPSVDTPVEHHETDRTHRTDGEGRIELSRLAPGPHHFKLVEPRGESSFVFMIGDTDLSDWTPVAVREGEVAELVLTKEPQGVLTGQVTENGQPLRNARLRLTPDQQGGGDQVNAILLSMEAFGDFTSGRGGATTTTDRNGRYELGARDVGTYTLAISHPDREMPERYPVILVVGTNVLDVDLPLTIVAGRVTDESGRPVGGARVTARRGGGDSNPLGGFIINGLPGLPGATATLTDADGNYELRGVASDAPFTLSVDAEGLTPGRSEVLELPANTRRDDVDFVLDHGASLTVVIPSTSEAQRVVVLQREGEPPKFRGVEGEEVRFDGLAAGTWKVSLNGDPGFTGHEEVVLEKGGEHRIVLDGKPD